MLLCAGLRANGIISDPSMGVERDSLSTAIFQGSSFAPAAGGGGVFGFYNTYSQNITELMFTTDIVPNLSPALVQQSFTCDQGNANPFFFYCSIQYLPSTGELGIAFWGTNLPPAPGTVMPGDEVGLHDGIPPLLSGCLNTPDAPGCTDVGHFAITLNYNYSLNGTLGGWNNTNSPGLFNPNGVTITAADISTMYLATPPLLQAPPEVPEPGTLALVAFGFLGFAWAVKRRARTKGK